MDSEPNDPQHEMSLALLGLIANFAPIIDAAEGFRTQMMVRGWGKEAAESAASIVLNGLLATAMNAGATASTPGG